MTAPPTAQDPLFTPEEAAPEQQLPGAVPYLAANPAALAGPLAGDGLDWLGRILPAPIALPCPRCRRPMRLPAIRLLWQCATCDNPPEKGASST